MKSKFTYWLIAFVFSSANVAFGQTTFTSVTTVASTRWNDGATWTQSGVLDVDGIPDANDIVIIQGPHTVNMTGGSTTHQAASLTILSGGTLDMNRASAVLDIVPNGGFLQVDAGAVISNASNDDNNEINFLNTGSLINNGSIQTDRLEFEGLNQTVNISGGGTLLVRQFRVNNTGVTIILNTTGSFGSNRFDFLVDRANLTLIGTGTMDIGNSSDLNLAASGLSIGCHLNLSDDVDLIVNSASLTVINGGVLTTVDDLRIGPSTAADNSAIVVQNGGTLAVGDDFNFNNDGTGSADNFTMLNSGVVLIADHIQFNNETNIAVTNFNAFTLEGNITTDPTRAAVGVSFTNAANATFHIGGSIDIDVALDFSANGNTVNYNNSVGVTQNIATTTYYNLTLSNTGAKRAIGSFALRGNWRRSGAAIFNPNGQTVTFSALAGTAAQSITAVGGESFNNLVINSAVATSPQITLNNPVTVGNTLNMASGVINLNGNTFTLGIGTGASVLNHVGGWMYGGSFRRGWPTNQTPSPIAGHLYGLFPLGNTSSYRPVAVTAATDITTSGSVTFTHVDATSSTDLSPVYDDDPTAGVINIVRKHNAQFIGIVSGVSGGATFTISVTMTGLLPGIASDIRLAVSNGATTVTNYGTHVANTGTASNPVVGRSGLTLASLTNDFRVTTINTAATPLPIELVYFKGEAKKDVVQLNWETASELGNDFFTVERSTDGEVFTSIGQLNGKGTTNELSTYSMIDQSPIYGTAYYRLKQTGFDGIFSYSKIIDVTYEGSTISVMDVFPNPSRGDVFNIRITSLKNLESVPVIMYDQVGKEYMKLWLDVDQNSGMASQTIVPEKALPQGIYVLKAGPTLQLIKRFVVNSK